MFGYIKVYKPELRIKEYEMYKSVYCTLCKRLGKKYGLLARFTLSYDFTFLSLLKMSLEDATVKTERKSCPFNPLKKCNYCTDNLDTFDFSAAAAQIMLYYKAYDNVKDEKGLKRVANIIFKRLLEGNHKKAAQRFPTLENIIFEYVTKQCQLEKDTNTSLDAAAEPTANALAKLFAECSFDATQKRILERLGYCLGRFIYITDAYSDLDADIKFKRYNPLIYKENPKETAVQQLYASINDAKLTFELLEIHKFKNILGNIIYLGLEDVLKKETN